MIQVFKYCWKVLLHEKSEFFWILVFPILLGSMFKVAFSNITSEENYQAIPVAIVSDGGDMANDFKTVADELNKDDDDRFLKVTYCDKQKALDLLEKQKVDGIIYANDTISLTVSSDMSSAQLNQSILQTFVEEFQMNYNAITDTAKNHPQNLSKVLTVLNKDTSYNKEVSYSKNNTDTYDQYFYNLLAMVCMYSGTAGCYIAIRNQGNLSYLGARRNISPTHKMKTIIGELMANVLFHFISIMISFAYIVLILNIDLTTKLPFAILSIFMGCLTGVSFGFFIGAIGNISEDMKIGIVISVTMLGCFLSGLMAGNMRIIVETYCPIINRINPCALIADSFYSLAIYDTLDRYTRNISSLLVLCVLFCVGGFLMTRRKKYANL